jgi:type II secretory pathway pseudopilin PulG
MTPSKSQQGFTILELLIGAGVATIGLFASMTLAMAALRGNTERRDSILAEQYAQHLLATIQAEGTIWTNDSPPANAGNLLVNATSPAVVGQSSGWLLVPGDAFASDKRVGALGANNIWDQGLLQELPNDRGTRFCSHYRLT